MRLATSIDQLQHQAMQNGYILSSPMSDMYGGYECCLENMNTGEMNVVMNCRTPIEAAVAALGSILREDVLMRMPTAETA